MVSDQQSDRVLRDARRALLTADWNSDGSDDHDFVGGGGASWSPDGKWLYYVPLARRNGVYEIEKIAAGGGASVRVRTDNAMQPSVGADGTLYQATPVVRKARPETADAVTLTTRDRHASPSYEVAALLGSGRHG